jgi:UDP-glucose 4-epimerase
LTYGWAKLTGEMLAKETMRTSDTRVHIFRPMTIVGSNQSFDYPVPNYIRRVLDKVHTFNIWGDGTQTRDFIWIDDVIATVMAAINKDEFGPLNLCTGIPTSFNRFAETMFDVAKWRPAHIRHLLDKPIGCKFLCGDPYRMLNLYEPKYTLRSMITELLLEGGHFDQA